MLCWVSQAQGFLDGLDLSGILQVWCPDQRSQRPATALDTPPDFLHVGGTIGELACGGDHRGAQPFE